MTSPTQEVVATLFRRESGRVLAALISRCGDFDLAEDVLQDALLTALERWPRDGLPDNPGAWITTTAWRKALDRFKRLKTYEGKSAILQSELQSSFTHYEQGRAEVAMHGIADERLKLIFTCCHPALAPEARIALTLRTLGGLSTNEIARAFLVPGPTMAQRIVRAKQKIKRAGIPYRVPTADVLAERIDAVLTVLYLIFNEGYVASEGDSLTRHDLCAEAIRLTYVLNELLEATPALQPSAEAIGLQALMLLIDARAKARVDADGELTLLEDQDRSLWDHAQIARGIALVEQALRMGNVGPYQLQAAIQAVHCEATTAQETDWKQIVALYVELMRRANSPVIALNHAVAVAMAKGPLVGLMYLDQVQATGELDQYHLLYAARADLLRRAGILDEAIVNYEQALTLVDNEPERRYLQRRLVEIMG